MGPLRFKGKDNVSIVLAGEAGQGIQTVDYLLTRVLKRSGYHVFSTKEFMSRIRGGVNSTEIRVSSHSVASFLDRIDILVPFTRTAITRLENRLSPETIILTEKDSLLEEGKRGKGTLIDVPFSKIASVVGSKIYANIVGVGLLSGFFRVNPEIVDNFLRDYFARKSKDIVQKNIEAARKGYDIGKEFLASGKIDIDIRVDEKTKDGIILTGAEAVALGAIAGGCNFVSFYPMSPATSVAVFLAQHGKEFGLLVEQAEDEISAINMVIGAWYAGARAMASTSGGGFALMVEGLSLAGAMEMPIVIHIGQRPGPATGLPTRTEQGDLDFVLKAGHGEFPRIILAPGSLEDTFYLTQKAFNIADKYQIPVFVLTDQYLLDSSYQLPSLDLSGLKVEKRIIKTDKGYKRYRITEDGISPRGVPGFGDGLVVVDSDEHDEEGHITEDSDVRIKMVEKRLRKLNLIKEDTISPELIGGNNYTTLILGWGSTRAAIKEALSLLAREDVSFLHFRQVYPLSSSVVEYLRKAKRCIVVENNATSQFGNLVEHFSGCEIRKRILKYNGLPFSVEEILKGVKELLEKEE